MTLHAILDQFVPGRTVYLPGATGEIQAIAAALAADPERMRGVTVVSCLLPGMNAIDYAAFHDEARLTTFLLPPVARLSLARKKVQLVPLSYFGIARYLESAPLDVAVAHVAPPLPGERRQASVGIAADFTGIAWAAAKIRIAFVNAAMPAMPRGPRINLEEAQFVVEGDSRLVEIPRGTPEPVGEAIARHVASIVPDGAALQVGIGSAPAALWRNLSGHRNLRLRSGLASEDLLELADCGALAADGHLAGIAAGSTAFYRALAERDLVRLSDTLETHDARAIGLEKRFIAANSALEVDLFGQVNLEWQSGKPASGVGGAPDFAAAALASPGGQGIIMLPSTARGGTISRIVARLDSPSVSLPRNLADIVVTEHGIARLRDAGLDARAEALIAIADPVFRAELSASWRDIRAKMRE